MFFKNKLSKNKVVINVEQLEDFLKEKGGNHVSHLFFLKDKEVFWTEEKNVLIVYKKFGKKLFVLGDPIGDECDIQNAIKEFCVYSNTMGLTPIYYQISPQYMQYYHESGYRFLKLGEEGIVDLQQFSLEGKKGAKLRTRMNKFIKNSFSFQVVQPPFSYELLTELKQISDSWLGFEKEKGFSVVSFQEDYVSRSPIALLYGPEGNVLAFATLATDYKQKITIDLMRSFAESPHGTMDVLFIHIFRWAKENGYQFCSLGMSPLSSVGHCEHSFTSEKLIRLVYLYGNKKYNFKGLKEFKGKFASVWEPKYLAYKKTSLPFTFIQLLLLINRTENQKNRTSEHGTILKKRERKLLSRSLN
ncbi:phosphatidylglycerol lysyltransferase [Ureibacillus xyleni]|uniref:Phosphatidylglycerol lysyltransferase n=1 Tax=Ureibacillus xyleni TaxID=614648 RepID=A0A285RYY4_9BACL|nr:phosphatidylglycerol lysyltransferase domain-containing protein [Ureibacillus xyleni]SOB99571.1 phosphatidylglycerol lysyltransferase [Ureibacillus xyleni]